MRIRYALIVLLAVLLTGCASLLQPTIEAAVSATLTAVAPTVTPTPEATPTPDCATLTNQWLLDIGPLVRQWDDALIVASSTGRIALSGPVKDLQSIARSIEEAPYPACAETARNYYLAYMTYKIEAFIKFMAQESSTDDLIMANVSYEQFQREVKNISTQ